MSGTFYIFGESVNDTKAIAHIIEAIAKLNKANFKCVHLRAPLIQQKGTTPATKVTNAEKVRQAAIARSTMKKDENNIIIVAHQDCDKVDPAYLTVEEQIEQGLKSTGFRILPVAPASEMEAWWFMWPDAVERVCTSWNRLKPHGMDTGRIPDAKKKLVRDLRPKGATKVRDYSETDAPTIARFVKELNLIQNKQAQSASFQSFEKRLLKIIAP